MRNDRPRFEHARPGQIGGSSARARSGLWGPAQSYWGLESLFPNPRLDRPRGHLDWRFDKVEYRPGYFEVYALDPRSGDRVGHVYYELHGHRVRVTILQVNARYQRTDLLLALLAHPRSWEHRGYRLEAWGLEPGSRLQRLYTRYAIRAEVERKLLRRRRLSTRLERFRGLARGLAERLGLTRSAGSKL